MIEGEETDEELTITITNMRGKVAFIVGNFIVYDGSALKGQLFTF